MMKKEFGKDHLYSEIFIEDDELYIVSTIENNGNFYKIKISKRSKLKNIYRNNFYRIYYRHEFEFEFLFRKFV